MIEEIIPGNKTELKIVKAIYENPGINLTGLIKKTRSSPNLVLKYVNILSSHSVIKEEKSSGKKKIHVRNLKANFDTEIAKNIYSAIEIDKKLLFLNRYREISPYCIQLEDILKNKTCFFLVYGSYARFTASKDSDLDILIVGNLKNEEIKRIREVFVTLEKELSLKIETIVNFIKNKDKPLYQNILKEHVIIIGADKYIDILNRIIS